MIGTQYTITEKISWAENVFSRFGAKILEDEDLSRLLHSYRAAITESWACMRQSGVSRVCWHCAVHEGGSCCGKGIEDRFDGVLLLVNLLLGGRLPLSRWDPEGCWFLGEQGCTIPARHVICINYLCRRITDRVPPDSIRMLQGRIGQEADRAFFLEEALKQWLVTQDRKTRNG